MRDIQDKTDGSGDILAAEAFNTNLINELQDFVTSAGFTLDPEAGPDTDTDMFAKSVVVHALGSQYFDESGAADAYVLTRSGNLQPMPSYIDGMIVFFNPGNDNTGASTINVDGLGAKDLVAADGSALTGGEVVADVYCAARYDSSSDDFELVKSAGDDAATLGGELPSFYATDSLVVHLAGAEIITGAKTFKTDTYFLPVSTSLTDYGTTGVFEERQAYRQAIGIALTNSETAFSGRQSTFLGCCNSGSAFYLSGGAQVTNNPQATLWATPTTTSAEFFAGRGGVFYWYGDTGLTEAVAYTPTLNMTLSASGNLAVTGSISDSVGTVMHLAGAETITGAKTFNADITLGTGVQILFPAENGDKLYLYGNTCGIGLSGGNTLNYWSPSQHIWRSGGTSAAAGDQVMAVTSTGNLYVDGQVIINNAQTGDSIIQFYDVTNATSRSLFWDDSASDWYVEDSSGVNRKLWHAGDNPSLGSGNGISGTIDTTATQTITVTNGIITAIA